MTKAELRTDSLTQRRSLTQADVTQRSQLIAGYFFDHFADEELTGEPTFVHSFLPIRRHNEVDTWLIINEIWTRFTHVAISVPVMESGTHRMTHYTITPATPVVENKLGIPEPAPENRIPTELRCVKAVLVPLLAFDRQGHRVGYGGGYYDRFLAEEVPHSRKIGLSLFEPVDTIAGVESTDVRLDACITPNGVYRFT